MTRGTDRIVRSDAGVTLLELIVAMGIFSLLMVVVSVFTISGLKSIRSTTAQNSIQGSQQNAAEWMSRLIRYTDNPYAAATTVPAIDYAGTVAGQPVLTFYTYAGVGSVDRVPYKVTITRSTRGIESTVWAPDMSSGKPVYTAAVGNTCRTTPVDATCTRRVLVPQSTTDTPTLALTYYNGVGTNATTLNPPANGTLTAAQVAQVKAVEFAIGSAQPGQSLKQRVVLENGQAS